MNWYEQMVSEASQLEQRKLLQLELWLWRALNSKPINEWVVNLVRVKTRELYPRG
jgi:hypothetical protein